MDNTKQKHIEENGRYSTATNSKYRSTATNSGDESTAMNSGDDSIAINSGYRSTVTNTGLNGLCFSTGKKGKASGVKGTVIFLVERGTDHEILNHILFIIDDETYKEDTFYTLVNGEVIETE